MTRYRLLPLVLATSGLLAASGLALTACSGAARPNGTPASSSVRDQALPVWREFAACVRSHGVPDVPDPQVDEAGQATWPGRDDAQIQQAAQVVAGACDAILQKLPPQAQPHSHDQIGAAELATLRRWAQCMRDHGLPDWPDPNADGTFTLPQRIVAGGKPLFHPAQDACKDVYNGSFRTS